jgi:prophage antirepressor-like protein
MTKITRYLFGVKSANTIATRTMDGQHWYMALDICNLLGIRNHSQAVHRKRGKDGLTLTENEWRKETMFIGGYGKKKVLLVNDSGMQKLIFQGTSPRAQHAQDMARRTLPSLIPAGWSTEMLRDGN